jgi:hypothetical protein
MNVAGVLGLASESGLNPFARLLVRLGSELSRTGKLPGDTRSRTRLMALRHPISTFLRRSRRGRIGPAPRTLRLFAMHCKYMIYWVFKFPRYFGLDSAAQGAASRDRSICEKPEFAARGSKACLISAVHFSWYRKARLSSCTQSRALRNRS